MTGFSANSSLCISTDGMIPAIGAIRLRASAARTLACFFRSDLSTSFT